MSEKLSNFVFDFSSSAAAAAAAAEEKRVKLPRKSISSGGRGGGGGGEGMRGLRLRRHFLTLCRRRRYVCTVHVGVVRISMPSIPRHYGTRKIKLKGQEVK